MDFSEVVFRDAVRSLAKISRKPPKVLIVYKDDVKVAEEILDEIKRLNRLSSDTYRNYHYPVNDIKIVPGIVYDYWMLSNDEAGIYSPGA